LYDWTPHEVKTVSELAELSDASVSRLRKIEYKPAFEEVESQDSASVREGLQFSDTVSSGDDRFINRNVVSEKVELSLNDLLSIDGNLSQVSDAEGIADEPFVDKNLLSFVDASAIQDTTAQPVTRPVTWSGGDWETLHWAVEHN
jgi:hypothetical protein